MVHMVFSTTEIFGDVLISYIAGTIKTISAKMPIVSMVLACSMCIIFISEPAIAKKKLMAKVMCR